MARWPATRCANTCYRRKGARDIREFLKRDLARLARVPAQARRSLKAAAAVNATRRALLNSLKTTRLAVEAAPGGRTRYNRVRLDVPKTHALDAVCVRLIATAAEWRRPTVAIQATGRGSCQRTRLDKHGFPRGYLWCWNLFAVQLIRYPLHPARYRH